MNRSNVLAFTWLPAVQWSRPRWAGGVGGCRGSKDSSYFKKKIIKIQAFSSYNFIKKLFSLRRGRLCFKANNFLHFPTYFTYLCYSTLFRFTAKRFCCRITKHLRSPECYECKDLAWKLFSFDLCFFFVFCEPAVFLSFAVWQKSLADLSSGSSCVKCQIIDWYRISAANL